MLKHTKAIKPATNTAITVSIRWVKGIVFLSLWYIVAIRPRRVSRNRIVAMAAKSPNFGVDSL